ncbi:hypothetical protein AB4Y44_20200 [Paraburkholderia sp. BR10937]|uniref:hypothetical protein n=1 Tax=Paraburkholderia sp. BR10937 TaxID=3236994 RepID=UPI0034D333E9
MSTSERSLRVQVEKWLGVDAASRTQVTRFCRSSLNPWRCVRVEIARASGALSIVFFRHEDGSWCVFPPTCRHPVMNGHMPAVQPLHVA